MPGTGYQFTRLQPHQTDASTSAAQVRLLFWTEKPASMMMTGTARWKYNGPMKRNKNIHSPTNQRSRRLEMDKRPSRGGTTSPINRKRKATCQRRWNHNGASNR